MISWMETSICQSLHHQLLLLIFFFLLLLILRHHDGQFHHTDFWDQSAPRLSILRPQWDFCLPDLHDRMLSSKLKPFCWQGRMLSLLMWIRSFVGIHLVCVLIPHVNVDGYEKQHPAWIKNSRWCRKSSKSLNKCHVDFKFHTEGQDAFGLIPNPVNVDTYTNHSQTGLEWTVSAPRDK